MAERNLPPPRSHERLVWTSSFGEGLRDPAERGEYPLRSIYLHVFNFLLALILALDVCSSLDAQPTEGPDMAVTGIDGLIQVGRVGETVALSLESTICNVGTEPVDWVANPDPNHPFLIFNLYRLENDRFEQMGESWAKHGITASQDEKCGVPCNEFVFGLRLGVGCSDTYGQDLNSDQSHMGPRSEINPWTGYFEYPGSYIDVHGQDLHDEVEHRLQARDSDIDPLLHPDARFFVELIVVGHDDFHRDNNIAYREFTVSGSSGGVWGFELVGPVHVGPALSEWSVDSIDVINDLPDDGRVHVTSKVSRNLDGSWHYEYALFNRDMVRAVDGFVLEIDEALDITNVGFHAPLTEEPGFGNYEWLNYRDADSFIWVTAFTIATPVPNPMRWGSLYNFRFDALTAPEDSEAVLSLFQSGIPASVTVGILAPSAPVEVSGFLRGDCDGDGFVGGTVGDALNTLNYLFIGDVTPGCLAACDFDGAGFIDMSDVIASLNFNFFSDPVPGAPYPACGTLQTPADIPLGCEEPPLICA